MLLEKELREREVMCVKREEDLASCIVNVTERESSCSWREVEVERGIRQVTEDGDARLKEREQLNLGGLLEIEG